MNIDDSDYANALSTNDEDLIIHDFAVNFGTFNYMPSNFLGIKTNELGFHIADREQSPFLQLTEKLIKEGSTLSIEDRMQGARYLCTVPYQNGTYHCTTVAWSIIKDHSVDMYKRYYFLSNRDQFFALSDHVIQCLHPLFLNYFKKLSKEFAAIVIPYDLLIMTIQYIFTHFGGETNVRQDALDWCLDCVNNDHESMHVKLKVYDLFIKYGHEDEKAFALQQFEEMKIESSTDYQLPDTIENVSAILRTLRTKYASHFLTTTTITDDTKESQFAPASLFKDCAQYILATYKQQDEQNQYIEALEGFFNEIVDGEGCFEGISIKQICYLLQLELQDIETNKGLCFKQEILRRFVAYMLDTIFQLTDERIIHNQSEYCVDILNLLDDFTPKRSFELGPSVLERLRNEIFAALNQTLFHLESGEFGIIQKSRASEDKSAVREFLVLYFDDEREILRSKYADLSDTEFNTIYNQVVEEWSN